MERKCPECGSTEVMEGTLNAMGGMAFVPCGQDRVILHGSYLQALACRKCGAVFGFTLTDKPYHLTDRDAPGDGSMAQGH